MQYFILLVGLLFFIIPPSVSAAGPVGQTGEWQMVFNDDFNGTSLDLTKWIMCNPSFASSCNPWNNEQEKFNTSQTGNQNIVVSNGILHLIATKDANGQIWSGMVSTGPNIFNYNQPGYESFQFTYGYYEGRVKMPRGNGLWPSLWMLPDQKTYGPWPDSGEYDVVEVAGNNPTKIHLTAHWGPNGSGICGHPCTPQERTVADTSADYHVYGFNWQPDGLTWYFDGQQMGNKITDPAAIKNTPFYIIANFSVGGSWPPLNGAPDRTTQFPSSMDIDYLRVWQKAEAVTAANPTETVVVLDLLLHGVGNSGDNSNPTSQGNMTPHFAQRTITVEVFNAQNQLILTKEGIVTFNATKGNFAGTISLGNTLANGSYLVKIKADRYLRALVPGVQTLTKGTDVALPQTTLVVGDINNDNTLNILDYNILMGCYSDFLPAANCTAANKIQADLTDDTQVNQIDYNLFLREMGNSKGQ